MQAHAARLADRLMAPFGGQAALVKRMAGLMQNGHDGRAKIAFVVARGDAHILGHAAAKRVMALVQPAMREIEAEALHQRPRKLALASRGEGSGGAERRRRLARLLVQNLGQKIGEKTRQIVENDVDLGAGEARVIAVDQGVIGRQAERRRFGRGLFPDQNEQRLEGLLKGGEITLRARLAPHQLACRSGLAEGRHQIGGQRIGVRPAVAHFPGIGLLPRT